MIMINSDDSDDGDDSHQADSLLDNKGAPLLRKLLDLLPRDDRAVRPVHDSSETLQDQI